MSFVVISSFENVATGDLQSQGEALAVFDSESAARSHFASRSLSFAATVGNLRSTEPDATFITWLLILNLVWGVTDADEALEDLELVIEETESVDDPFGELVVAYQGFRHEPNGSREYAQADALRELEAWLT